MVKGLKMEKNYFATSCNGHEQKDIYQIETAKEELGRENVKLAMRLRTLLDEGIPLSEIPKRMLVMDDVHSPLTMFNYKNFYYLQF